MAAEVWCSWHRNWTNQWSQCSEHTSLGADSCCPFHSGEPFCNSYIKAKMNRGNTWLKKNTNVNDSNKDTMVNRQLILWLCSCKLLPAHILESPAGHFEAIRMGKQKQNNVNRVTCSTHNMQWHPFSATMTAIQVLYTTATVIYGVCCYAVSWAILEQCSNELTQCCVEAW